MEKNFDKIEKLLNKTSNKSFVFFSHDENELNEFVDRIPKILNTNNIFKLNAEETLKEDMNILKDHHFSSSIEDGEKIILIHLFEKLSIKQQNELLVIIEENVSNDYFIFTTTNINNIVPTILSRVNIYKFINSENIKINISDQKSKIFSKLVNSQKNFDLIMDDTLLAEVFDITSNVVENIEYNNFHELSSLIINNKDKLSNKNMFFNILIFLLNENNSINPVIKNKINKIILEYKKNLYLRTNEILFYDSFAIKVKKVGTNNE